MQEKTMNTLPIDPIFRGLPEPNFLKKMTPEEEKEVDYCLQFEACLVAALEFATYAKDRYKSIYQESIAHRPRAIRNKEMRDFEWGFNSLMSSLKRFSNLIERDNPQFFDDAVDEICELVKSDKIRWR